MFLPDNERPIVKRGPGGDFVRGYNPGPIEWRFVMLSALLVAFTITISTIWPQMAIGFALGFIVMLFITRKGL